MSPELAARIHTQVRTIRQAQGLGPHVTDVATLDRLARRVAEVPEHGGANPNQAATVRHQGDAGRADSASDAAVLTPSAERLGVP